MSLFTTHDLLSLAEMNLGLRLTNNTKEAQFGGFGDAIPLSSLAGAIDIIKFIFLSFSMELQREQMEKIYDRYKQTDIKATDCMPRLILHYAAKHNISDAKERLSHYKNEGVIKNFSKLQIREIESEGQMLAAFYRGYTSNMFSPFVLETIIKLFPYLAQELAYNFNEKLLLRLRKNWNVYATNDDMDYLFLSDFCENQKYVDGYDFNNYPLGKVGKHQFDLFDVKKQVMFLAGNNRTPASEKNIEERIFEAIKELIKIKFYGTLQELQQRIEKNLSKQPNYPDSFKNACNGMFALVARLQENEQLSSDESIDLLKKTERLIHKPAEYKTFLTEAKKYRMVADGWLAAYMMLIAGWAAKIMTFNHVGNAWIKLANEKIDFLTTTEQFANASEAYSKGI